MKRILIPCALAALLAIDGVSAAPFPITLLSSDPYRLVLDGSGKAQTLKILGTNFENEGHPERDQYMHWQIRRDDTGWQRCGKGIAACDNTGWASNSETFKIGGMYVQRVGFIELRVFRGLGESTITDPKNAASDLSGWSNALRIPVVIPAVPPKINSLSKSTFPSGGSPSDFRFTIDSTKVDSSVVVIFRGDTIVPPESLSAGHLIQVTVPAKYQPKSGGGELSLTIRTTVGGESAPVWIHFAEPPKLLVAGRPGGAVGSQTSISGQPAGQAMLPKGPTPIPGACAPGFVWREAIPSDHVCVTPEHRKDTLRQNSEANAHRLPNGGPSGPDSCRPGFVWRDAFPNDHVCVTVAERAAAAEDNKLGPTRFAK